MNSDNKALWIALTMVVGLLVVGGKDRGGNTPSPSGTEAIAAKAVKQFAASLADIAEEAASKEPNVAAKSLPPKVIPAFKDAWVPVNEAIDQAIEDGTFEADMRKIASGYRKASK